MGDQRAEVGAGGQPAPRCRAVHQVDRCSRHGGGSWAVARGGMAAPARAGVAVPGDQDRGQETPDKLAGLPPLRQTKRIPTAGRTLPLFARCTLDFVRSRPRRPVPVGPAVKAGAGTRRAAQAAPGPGRDSSQDAPDPRPRMPPRLYLPPAALACCDPPAFDRAVATLLLGLDLGRVAATSEQPAATGSPAPGRQAADRASGYHPAVQQPNRETAPSPPPRVLIADDAPAMRAALRGLLEDHGLPSSARPPTGCRPSPWPPNSSPMSW